MELVARSFNTLYVWLDMAWLVLACTGLFLLKRRMALLAGLAGGLLYFLVDYGIFYLILKTRIVTGADPFWYLLWLSFSYGITNFAWIWLMLDRDKRAVEWTVILVAAWFAVAMLSRNFGGSFPVVGSSRGTGAYHGVMALFLFAGYLILAVQNIARSGKQKNQGVNVLFLMAVGIGIQLAWESVLFLSGIRPANLGILIRNSLLETNMGIPYLYLIHKAISSRYREDLSVSA